MVVENQEKRIRTECKKIGRRAAMHLLEPWTACTRTIFHWRVDETRLGGRGKGRGGTDDRGREKKREASKLRGFAVRSAGNRTDRSSTCIYTVVIARAAGKGAFYPAESEAY